MESTERVYIRVVSEFDQTGYMQPRSVIWPDGRIFPIDMVRGVHPEGKTHMGCSISDCYTVMIRGREKKLFFRRNLSGLGFSCGRWYVERRAKPDQS